MHADAADVGYGGTLGLDMAAGSPGLWEGRGIWTAEERAQSITLRELRAVRLLLHRHFSAYVSDPHVKRLLLHEDNQAVVTVLNAMVASSPALMSELRKLRAMLASCGVRIEARWIPSAVNRFADSLSQTWDPGDMRATESLLSSLQREYRIDRIAFAHRPLNEHPVARRKHLSAEMNSDWGDGKARLWAPPFDLLPLVVRKIESQGGIGVLVAPRWPTQPWFERLRVLSSRLIPLDPVMPSGAPALTTTKRGNPDWRYVLAEIECEKTGSRVSA